VKVGKIILITIAVTVVVVGGTSLLLMNNMDRLAKESFEKGGFELLGTQVNLEKVSITLLAGKARFSGLRIGNPEGYSSAAALNFGLIEVDIDLGSVNEDVLVIEHILIQDPIVSYEINKEGVANIDVLLQRIEDAAPSSDSNSGLMIIDRLDIKGGSITASAAHKPDQELVFDFPVLFMSNLGEPRGLSPEQIGAKVSEALMERIVSAATRAGVDSLLEVQKERLEEKAREKIDEKLKKLLKRD